MLFEVATVIGFVLVLARTSAMVLVAPIFAVGPSFQGYKMALIVSVSLCIFLALGIPEPEQLTPAPVVVMLLREVFLGLFLGYILHVVTLTIRVGGEMIGQEMGFMVARQIDPATGIQIPLITSIYDTLFILAMFAMNGHHWLLRALSASFERAPVGRMDFSQGMGPMLMKLFSEMFGAGIVFGAPVMLVLSTITILMGLLARMSPQLNVMELGYTIRVVVAMFTMVMFAPLLEPSFERIAETFIGTLEQALDVMET